MLEQYLADVNSQIAVDPMTVDVNIGQCTFINPSIVVDALSNIDNIDDNYLYDMILHSYSVILSKEFLDDNKVVIAKAFTNSKFVTIFSRAMSGVRQLTNEQRVCCNKMIYDYLSLQRKKDMHIEGLLYNLGLTINRDDISGLLGLGLDQNTVANLAIARYSTEKQTLAVKRINVIIVNSSISVMTEQKIVNIYEKLFKHLMPLFEGIMFDRWDEDLFQDEDSEEIYGLINLALLDILNEMPSSMIEHILTQYSQLKEMIYVNKPTRFNIHSISYDYERIINAIDRLEQQYGIIVPR